MSNNNESTTIDVIKLPNINNNGNSNNNIAVTTTTTTMASTTLAPNKINTAKSMELFEENEEKPPLSKVLNQIINFHSIMPSSKEINDKLENGDEVGILINYLLYLSVILNYTLH